MIDTTPAMLPAAGLAPAAPAAAAPAESAMPRRTFAIISHPDAGKTTLTEKLLLFGGAIRMAGQVRARGEQRRTRSDWMEIEKARGISVSSSVMTFERDGVMFNLLDTPGHQDFSEDTYRTLTAVDSAIMVIDAAKGIENQTRKLFEVCRLRDIPIITFINKVDREARNPFELLDEIEDKLQLHVAPATWPIGMGADFRGCYDLLTNEFLTARQGGAAVYEATLKCTGPDDPQLDARVPAAILAAFREEVALAASAYAPLDPEVYRSGHQSPVLFGSALNNFAVTSLIDLLAAIAPSPRPQPAEPHPVDPSAPTVAGFVFKVQANMDPNHRDRLAFMRLCSGKFQRGMKLKHVRSGRTIAIHNPIFFFARERALAEEAMPGDIIGIPNHGTLRVGDALTEGENLRFTGIPNFAPEVLRRLKLDDPIRAKQLRKALDDLAEEGVTQVFRPVLGSDVIVGVVGELQLDVLKSRIVSEYKVDVSFEPTPYHATRWFTSTDPAALKKFISLHRSSIAEDRDGGMVYMPLSQWELNRTLDEWSMLKFTTTRERA